MAYFEGTVEEFMRFLGGYARNRVQSLTSAYRKKIGKCEECGSHTKQLDAAHLHGKERLVIIGEILKDFTEDGVVKIDLNVFQEIFDQAHQPPENVIRSYANLVIVHMIADLRHVQLRMSGKQGKKENGW